LSWSLPNILRNSPIEVSTNFVYCDSGVREWELRLGITTVSPAPRGLGGDCVAGTGDPDQSKLLNHP